MNWDDLRFFVSLIENKTASSAAKELNVNYTTVCRRIERLEFALKQKLVYYKENCYYPTLEGEILYQKSKDIALSLKDIKKYSRADSHLKQTITISSTPSITEKIVIPNLKNFLSLYPQLKVNYLLSNKISNIHKRECDIAIRFVNNAKPEGEHLKDILYHECCSHDYDKQGNEKIIAYNYELKKLPENNYILQKYGENCVSMEVNTLNALYTSIKSGYGVGLLPEYLVDDSIKIRAKNVFSKKLNLICSDRLKQITLGKIIMEELVKIFQQN